MYIEAQAETNGILLLASYDWRIHMHSGSCGNYRAVYNDTGNLNCAEATTLALYLAPLGCIRLSVACDGLGEP
jgi:hypothetical protein